MKNMSTWLILSLGIMIPCFAVASSSDGWVAGHQVSSSQYLEKTCVGDESIKNFSCDYTGNPIVLRKGYDVAFSDRFFAGSQKRRLFDFCAGIIEPAANGNYNKGPNPGFERTDAIKNAKGWVEKDTDMLVIKSKMDYQIKDHPAQRSDDNLMVKYVVEYSNDENGNTRYQHTECYPYVISRCGDGVVDKDWNGKTASTPAEECDPEAPERKNRTDGLKCSASCTIVQGPVCNSTYDGKRIYTSTSSAYLNGTEGLCTSGSVFKFTPSRTVGNPRIFTWGCTSSVGSTADDACSYKQYRCGDGIISAEGTNWNYSNGAHYEKCDPEAPEWKNRTDGQKCNSSCNIEYVPSSCGTLDGNTAYNSGYSSPRITENSAGLCGTGKLVAGSLSYDKDTGKYTWKCQNGVSPAVSCNAQDLWCGDGKYQKDYEQCDPSDPNRTNWEEGKYKKCESCKLADIPRNGGICSSSINKQTEYTNDSNPWLTKDTPGLCDRGSVKNFKGSGSPRTFTRECENDGISTGCVAYQQRCGDGKKNGSEICDPEDGSHSGWGDAGCSKTCEPEYGVKCGSKYNGKTTYLDISKDWITKNTQGLCDSGNVVNFYKHPSSRVYTWQCENHGKYSEECRADQEWCGDEKTQKDHGEDCDGTEGCDSECKKIIPTSGCDQIFYGELRLGEDHTFSDKFNAGGKDRYLYYGPDDVKFVENHGDYNNGANPKFGWTSQLVNNGMKVNANSSMVVIESKLPNYHIYTAPTQRAWNNIYIEYTIWYGNEYKSPAPSKSNLYSHQECAYYEISRCGDGQIDEEYGEECDPGDSSHTNWGNGGCDENTCTPTNVSGPVCNSQYSGQVVENLTESDELCSEGTYVPGSLHFDEATNTWTWECNNTAGEGVECSATKPSPKGTAVIEKVLKNKVPVDHTGQALDWIVTVTASGGNISDFEIQDKMPIELDYLDFELDKNNNNTQNGIEVIYNKGKSGKRSGDVNLYYWDVKGTLYSGNKITMIVKTEVNRMPLSGEDILNIACVIKDNKTLDCDEDEPPKPEVKGTAVIEKVLQNKVPVDHTGQALDWIVTVTASGGNISDFEIQDKMPIELNYSGFKLDTQNTQNGIEVTYNKGKSGKRSGDVNLYYWDVKGTLYSGNKITMIVKTEVNRMPLSGEDILNIACVIKDNKTLDCDEDEPPKPGDGRLEVVKTLISESKYVTDINQELKWKITVKAKDGDVKLAKITDKFPAQYLEFTDYEPHDGWTKEGISIQDFRVDNSKGIAVWDVKGTLKEGHTIDLIVYTKVHTMPNGEVENVGCVKPEPGEEECGTGHTSDLRIRKHVWDHNKWAKSTTGNSGDTITYKIEFGNNGDKGIYVSLKDFLPKDIEVKESSLSINGTHSVEFGSDDQDPYRGRWEKVDNVYINIYSGVYLGPKASGVMMITGTALHEEGDTHNRTNFVCIYDDQGNKIACDDAVYNVEEEKEFKCESLEGVDGDLTVSNGREERTKEVTCNASTDNAKITIDCGNGDTETKEGVKSFTKTCTFKGVRTHTVKCTVVNSENKSSDCEGSFQMKTPTPPTTPVCLRIAVDTRENEVTCYANKAVKFKVNGCYRKDKEYESNDRSSSWTFECDQILDDVKCTVSDDGSFDRTDSTKTCEWEDEDDEDTIKTTPWKQTCFNVNAGNFSIEEGEILPFYWNLDRVREVTRGDHPYDQIDGNYDTAKDKLNPNNGYVGESCDYASAIATDSMVCTFGIYDGGNYFKGMKNGDPVENSLYEIKGPCLTDMTWEEMPDILQDWYKKMKERYCGEDDKDCLSFELPEYKNRLPEDRKGEYPDLLYSSVYYIDKFGTGGTSVHLANLGEGSWGLKTPTDGAKDKSYGEYKIVLESVEYLECLADEDGESLTWQVMTGDITKCQSNFMLTNSYTVQKTPSGNITASTEKLKKYLDIDGTENFAEAYLKAIADTTYKANSGVENALAGFRQKYEKLAVKVEGSKWGNIKKVPGKNIYFADGDITINGTQDIKSPFTWIVDGTATIKGNVKYNMMVLATDIVFSGDCNSNQKVKGIYYASHNLSRKGIVKNTENAKKWCSEGGLHVQGVLIGGNFEGLMAASRSNINNWFYVKKNQSQEQRKKLIMDGASVLIEYSPSIFTQSTMPPGAEDFISALSIYKQ